MVLLRKADMTQEERNLMIKIASTLQKSMELLAGNQSAIIAVDTRVNAIEKFILDELTETSPVAPINEKRSDVHPEPIPWGSPIGPMRVTTHINKKMPDGSLAFELDLTFENSQSISAPERMMKSLSFFGELEGVMKKFGVEKIIGEFDRKKTHGTI